MEEKTCKKFRLLKRLVDDELCVADVMDLTFPNGTVDLVTLGDFYGGTNLKDMVGDMVGQAERCETAAQTFGDKKGWASPSPLICVISYKGSHLILDSIYDASRGFPVAGFTSTGNIIPLLKFPLCAKASTSPFV